MFWRVWGSFPQAYLDFNIGFLRPWCLPGGTNTPLKPGSEHLVYFFLNVPRCGYRQNFPSLGLLALRNVHIRGQRNRLTIDVDLGPPSAAERSNHAAYVACGHVISFRLIVYSIAAVPGPS